MMESNLLILAISSLAGKFLGRREFVLTPSILLPSSYLLAQENQDAKVFDTKEESVDESQWRISLPLERFFGGTNSIRVGIYGQPKRVGNRIIRPKRIYKLIVDTGSPYLTIPYDGGDDSSIFYNLIYEDLDHVHSGISGSESITGVKYFFQFLQSGLSPFINMDIEPVPFLLGPSEYNSTEDIYGTKLGVIEWKESSITLRTDRLTTMKVETTDVGMHNGVVLGVLDETLTSESGGPLFGLVKRSNKMSDKVQLRPSILDQIGMKSSPNNDDETREITSFQIDSPNKLLTILADKDESLIPRNSANIIKLVDLRPLGDFVDHYAFSVDSLSLNYGQFIVTPQSLISSTNKKPRPIVAVFDTGLTGCLLTLPLWKELINCGIKDPSAIKAVEILGSKSSEAIISSDESNPFFYLSSIELDWFDDPMSAPFVVVLGQTFLAQGTLTIDINRSLASFDIT